MGEKIHPRQRVICMSTSRTPRTCRFDVPRLLPGTTGQHRPTDPGRAAAPADSPGHLHQLAATATGGIARAATPLNPCIQRIAKREFDPHPGDIGGQQGAKAMHQTHCKMQISALKKNLRVTRVRCLPPLDLETNPPYPPSCLKRMAPEAGHFRCHPAPSCAFRMASTACGPSLPPETAER